VDGLALVEIDRRFAYIDQRGAVVMHDVFRRAGE